MDLDVAKGRGATTRVDEKVAEEGLVVSLGSDLDGSVIDYAYTDEGILLVTGRNDKAFINLLDPATGLLQVCRLPFMDRMAFLLEPEGGSRDGGRLRRL